MRDIDGAVEHYLTETGAAVALDFIDALEETHRQIAAHPATGSPRYAHELEIPGLRFRAVKRFPYLVFYVEREAEIDVWRRSCTGLGTFLSLDAGAARGLSGNRVQTPPERPRRHEAITLARLTSTVQDMVPNSATKLPSTTLADH